MMVSNRNLVFQGVIFRWYVSFREGKLDFLDAISETKIPKPSFGGQPPRLEFRQTEFFEFGVLLV